MSTWVLDDDFVLDEERRSLAYSGEPDKTPEPLRKGVIPPGLLTLLMYFVKHRGQFRSPQQLGAEAWSTEQEQVYVAPETVKKSISRLRAYLGDSGKAQRIIAVQRRQGYCFVAKCEPRSILASPASDVAPQTPHNVARTDGSAVPYSLQALIDEKTAGFVGRAYVFAAIETFVRRESRGYLTITGDPGVGKSALLARYVQKTGCVAHFNARSYGITHASQCLESLCTQLIARYCLPYATLPATATRDGAFLAQLLEEVSGKRGSEERVVIAVDALDEVDLTGHPSGANVLYLPAFLPPGIYFVLTLRRDRPLPFVVHTPQQAFDFRQYPTDSREDVRTYIEQATASPTVRAWIDAQQDLTPDQFVTILADKSQDNFMYLRYVLADIAHGLCQTLRIEHLPAGLGKYYEDHWDRMGMRSRPLPRTKIKIVYVLSVVEHPVARRLIAKFVHEDELTVQEVLDAWQQFLHAQQEPGDTRYSVYHSSFRDFLARQDIVQAAGVTLPDIHAMIVDSWEGSFFDQE